MVAERVYCLRIKHKIETQRRVIERIHHGDLPCSPTALCDGFDDEGLPEEATSQEARESRRCDRKVSVCDYVCVSQAGVLLLVGMRGGGTSASAAIGDYSGGPPYSHREALSGLHSDP